jgi:hypothetical protein
MERIHPKLQLSALWLVTLLNVIFRDIHQMTMKSHLEMLLTGYYNGMEVTEEIILFGGIVLEIPIAMILFSLLLKRKTNRVVNIIALVISAALFMMEMPGDMDDWFFRIVEFGAFTWIFLTIYQWKEDSPLSISKL